MVDVSRTAAKKTVGGGDDNSDKVRSEHVNGSARGAGGVVEVGG